MIPFSPHRINPCWKKAIQNLQSACKKHQITAIVGMKWVSRIGLENPAYVISGEGKILGYQTKK